MGGQSSFVFRLALAASFFIDNSKIGAGGPRETTIFFFTLVFANIVTFRVKIGRTSAIQEFDTCVLAF